MRSLMYLFLPAVVSLFILSCQSHDAGSSNIDLAKAWIDLLNKHDTVAISNMYSDSARIESPNWEGVVAGPAGIKTVYARYFSGTPDLHHTITHLLANDSSLVIEYQSSGTFLHPEQGTPAYMQGKRYSLQNCTRMIIHEGKIIGQKNYFDQVAFLRQVGFFDPH